MTNVPGLPSKLATRASANDATAELELPQARVDEFLRKILRRCAAAALGMVATFGAVSIVAWIFDLGWIKHPIVHQPSLPPGAAILFFLSSAGLMILLPLKGQANSYVGFSLASFISIAGGVTFLEHILGTDWHLNYPLYQNADSTPLTFPGPMLPDTSLSFCMLGICLILFTLRHRLGYRPMQIVALLLLLPHVFIFMCKVCGFENLCAFFGCLKLSPITSLTFIVYCFGLLFLDASQGLTNIIVRATNGGKFVRRICSMALATCAAVPFLAYVVRIGESNNLYDETIAGGGTALILVLIVVAFVGWFFSRYDIIESEKIQANASEQRVRAIINGVPVGLVSLTRNGQIEFMNPAAAAMFQTDALTVIGKDITQFFVVPKNVTAQEFWLQLQEKPKGFVSELTARSNNGEFPAEFSLADFDMPDGPRFLASILDVTSRYEIQQLRQAFVAMVSHELRTPLASIGGFLNLLSMGAFGDVGEKVEEEADAADKSVKRLMSLINDLLDLEKLESGTILITFGPCDLAAIFADSLNAVNVFAQERSVTVRMPQRCCIECTADANRIVQVLVNLISNAVKFSPPDSTVSVEFEELEKWLKIKVVDQGRGIPARFRESIFERFQQVEASDAQKKGGTGLGLAICKAIVEQHGGSIGVDSVEGEGSTFWFTLPYENDENDATEAND